MRLDKVRNSTNFCILRFERHPKLALIDCDECGKQISDKAIHCIQCGAPIGQLPNSPIKEPFNTKKVAEDDSVKSFLELHPEASSSNTRRKAELLSCRPETGGGTIRDTETQTVMSYSPFDVSDGKLLSGHEGSIIEYEKSSGRLLLIAPENTFENQFVKKSGRIKPTQPESASSQFKSSSDGEDQIKSSSDGEDQNKISKNYIWYLMIIILLGGFWFSKGTPSPELIFAGSQAKSACVRLASENKGSGMILDNVEVVANATWLKDGKRVVQLTQTDNGKIRTIMCLYGNGMVSIPSMFEQSRWR